MAAARNSGTRGGYPGRRNTPPFWLLFVFLLVTCFSANANTVTLAWDPVAEADGYRLYWGTAPGVYTDSFDVGNFTMHTVPLLVNTVTYYFAVTAYNEFGESDFSSEISTTIPPLPTPVDLYVAPSPDILTWSIPTQPDTLLGFQVFRKEIGVAGERQWTVFDPASRSLAMPDAIPGSTYQFRVRGFTRFEDQPIFSATSLVLDYTKELTGYYWDTPVVFPPVLMEDSSWRIIFYGPQHWSNTVWASEDLVAWRLVGTADEFVAGRYRVFDPADAVQQFYQIRQ